MVFGEITTSAKFDYNEVIRATIKRIGFDDGAKDGRSALSDLLRC